MMTQSHLRAVLFSLLTATSAAGLIACEQESPAESATKTAPAQEASPPKSPDDKGIQVSAEGTKFDPAIASERLPAGVLYCDMAGTVHFATRDAKTEKCPVCGMELTHKD